MSKLAWVSIRIAAVVYFLALCFAAVAIDVQVGGVQPGFMSRHLMSEPKILLSAIRSNYRTTAPADPFDLSKVDFSPFLDRPEIKTAAGIPPSCDPNRTVNTLQMTGNGLRFHSDIDDDARRSFESFFFKLQCPDAGNPIWYAATAGRKYNGLWTFYFSIDKDGIHELNEFGEPKFRPHVFAYSAALLLAIVLGLLNWHFLRRTKYSPFMWANFPLITGYSLLLAVVIINSSDWVRI